MTPDPRRLFLSPPHLGEAELRFVGEAFESNYIAPLGPMVDAFEREFAAYTGIPHCLALASGTAAMHLALRELGVGPGDEVLASTLTFIGSVSPATFLGASVAFIDADAGSWNMDPDLLAVELAECARRGKLPKAVIPTDLYGQCCDLERIKQVCERYGIPVVADAAEAMGARYQETGRADGKADRAKAEKLKTEMLKTGHRWVALSVICASIAVLTFWSFRETEWRVARRVVSVGNINDFSWRNRVAAWEGALQMMADKPWFGFGWNQPERVYDSFYRPARLTEGGAMQMNDYLMLGSTLGVPALLCFLMYVGLCLKGSPRSKAQSPKFNGQRTEDRGQRTEVGGRRAEDRGRRTEGGLPNTDHRSLATDHWAKAVCRAGAVVLLVGFWFDGGLFKLATAAPFWILLEVGRDD